MSSLTSIYYGSKGIHFKELVSKQDSPKETYIRISFKTKDHTYVGDQWLSKMGSNYIKSFKL